MKDLECLDLRLSDSFPFPVWRSGCDAKRDYFNRKWLDFTGRTLEQELGDGWSAGIHPSDLHSVLRSYQDAFHVRALFETEYRLRRHDGEYRWVLDCGAPFEDAGGNFAGYIGGCYDITQRKQTEEELISREGQSEEAQFLASLGSWKWEIPTGALTWSDELYRILGLDKEAFCPTLQTFHDFLHPDDRALFKGAIDDCLKGRRTYDCELRTVRPDGTVRTLRARGRAIFDETGKPLRMIGTAQDITGWKRAEERIRELGAIVESSDDAILGKTLDGIITSWNKGAEKIYGYVENEVIGQPISILVPTDRQDEAPQILGRLARGEAVDHYETVRRRKDGQEIQISLTISPIRNLAGRITGASSIARDVTERKRVERELLESEERFRELTENIHEVFWVSDLEKTQMIYVSPAYERIWGRSCESLYASPKSWTEAIHPEDKGRVVAVMANNSLQVSHDITYRIVRPDGSIRWIRDRAFPVHDAAGRVIRKAGIAEDVTERRQLEMQLRQAQKMEAVGQLAGGVAHDFNNLLGVILNYATFVREELTDADAARWGPVREDVEQIEQAARRATDLTHQLLAFARREVIHPEVISLGDSVRDTQQLLRRSLGEHIELSTSLEDELWPVLADPGQMEQILVNLAVNARDAMPGGGRLLIETANVDVDESYASTRPGLEPGRYVQLRVSDNGEGMDTQTLERAFEPFYTTKPKGEGTGLGLATIYGIITQAGGYVRLYSERGFGTACTVMLPATEAQAPIARPPDERDLSGRGEFVLVVEDEDGIREVARRVLDRGGYRVLTAASGQEAIELVHAHDGPIDLLITDVIMPGMMGHEVAAEIAALRPSTRIMYMSGYAQPLVGPSQGLPEDTILIEKPFTERSLMLKVREALGAQASGRSS
jgi:two-component system cell cycle sensor histidine kinase/response regulator CckA